MVQNKQIRNFLFLLSGIVLLFCGSIPNFAESVIALLRGLLSFINLGWIGTLLIISRVLLILGGTALSVIGAIFMIQDATAAKRQPNWWFSVALVAAYSSVCSPWCLCSSGLASSALQPWSLQWFLPIKTWLALGAIRSQR